MELELHNKVNNSSIARHKKMMKRERMAGVGDDDDDDDEDDETWLHFMDMLERLSVSLYTSFFCVYLSFRCTGRIFEGFLLEVIGQCYKMVAKILLAWVNNTH